MRKETFVIGGHEFGREELEEYGMEYLRGREDEIYPMDMLNELEDGAGVCYVLTRAYYGEDFYPFGDNGSFCPNRAYFCYDGSGNYMSIGSDVLAERIEMCLDARTFLDWCREREYIEAEEEL